MQLQPPKPQLGQQQQNQLEQGSEGLVQLDQKSPPRTNRIDPSPQKQSILSSEQQQEQQLLQPLHNSPHYKIQLCRESDKVLGLEQNSTRIPVQSLKSVPYEHRGDHQSSHEDNKKTCQASIPQDQKETVNCSNERHAQNSPVPSVKKQRPNFIELPDRSRPELPRAGQNENRALHSKIIQRTVEQHQNNRRVNKSQSTGDINGERSQTNHIHNGHMPPKELNCSTKSKDDQTQLLGTAGDAERPACEKPSKQPMTFFTKLSSKFLSPDTLNSPCDSLCSQDSTPWNMEGTETIVENPFKKTKAPLAHNPVENKQPSTFADRELEILRTENRQLKAALEEAGRLNAQWRAYHQERQGHVDRLLATIHSLQQRHNSSSPPSAVTKSSEVSPAPVPPAPADEEVQRLRDALSKAQAEHQEHVTLLQMQVRAHRDDWEAESAEKRLERTAREQAEAGAALLLQEVHHLQQKLSDAEGGWSVCTRCGATPYPGVPPPSGGHNRKFLPTDHANNGGERPQHLPFAPPHAKQVASSHQLKPLLGANGHLKDMNGCEANKISVGLSGYMKQQGNNAQKQAQVNAYTKHSATNGFKDGSLNPTSAGVADNHIGQHVEQTAARVKQKEVVESCSKTPHPPDCLPPVGAAVKPFGGCGFQPTLQDAQLEAPQLASASSVGNNIPLKGWIPVSMMHQIAFGGFGESKRLQYPHSYTVQAPNNYMNGPNSYYRNYVSPSTSRESSLVSCTSSESTPAVQSPGLHVNCPANEKKGKEFGGARPKTAVSRPMSLEDDQRKAKHRARNILANAIPVSPVSSGPSTPAGAPPPRPYPPTTANPQTQYPLAKPNSTNGIVEIADASDYSPLVQNSSVTKSKEISCSDVVSSNIKDCNLIGKELQVSSPIEQTEKIGETSNLTRDSKVTSNENELIEHKIAKSSSNDTKSANANSNQISASASNETSRSSSPGMSLTTFALTSEGRGIPGAICFSLHPDVKPCINKGGVLTSPEPTSPKKELSVSSVHIEPKSPRPMPKSPIEISTKEHWWSVGEQEHFKYPEKAETVSNNGTLVNSTYVKLQDSGKKDSHSEIRTARAVSSQELAQNRKNSQEEATKISAIKKTSATNTTTFSFTPAVNSSASSSNLSSVDSSKACSPPLQPTTHLKSIASKNIASAIISYEIAAKGDHIVYADRLKPSDVVTKTTPPKLTTQPDGVTTISCKEIICPSCQMLFARDQHLLFLDHFETCKGPEFADL